MKCNFEIKFFFQILKIIILNFRYEKKTMASRKKKIETYYDDLERIHQQYTKLSNSPFKIVEVI